MGAVDQTGAGALDPVVAAERQQVLVDLLTDLIQRQGALLKRFEGDSNWEAGLGPLYQQLDESFQAVKRSLEKVVADGLKPEERVLELLERSREHGELLGRQVARRQKGLSNKLASVRVRRRQVSGAGSRRASASGRHCDMQG